MFGDAPDADDAARTGLEQSTTKMFFLAVLGAILNEL